MSVFSDLAIARKEAGTMDRAAIEWALSQCCEEFAAAIMPVSINPAMREAYVSPENLMVAMLSPVSFGAVVADIAERLGVATPWSVRRAIGDDALPPAAD